MPNLHELENAMPVAPLKLVTLQSAAALGNKVNDYLVEFRSNVHNKYVEDPAFQGYSEKNYQLDFTAPRFNSGEGKADSDIILKSDKCCIRNRCKFAK